MNGTRLGAIVAVSLQFVLLVSVAYAETDLSFSGAPVVVDGNGIDTGSVGTTARWTNVGTINGTDLDLVIEVMSNNRSGDSLRFTTDGDDASVWLDGVSGQVVELDYNFFEAGTSTSITIIPEALIQDLDSDIPGTSTLQIVRVLTSQIANYTLEADGLGSDLAVVTLDNGTPGDFSDDEFEVTSGASGSPGDSNISIEFDFQPLATIRLTFATANGASGQQFSFDGNADNFFTTRGENKQDLIPPVTPTVTLLATNDATPTLTGTAEAFTTMTVVAAGATFEVVTESDGTWSLDTGNVTPETGTFNPNIDGSALNDVEATSTDAAGNSTIDVGGSELFIDATPPTLTISTTSVVNVANETSFSFSGNCTNGDGPVTVSVAGASPPSLVSPCSTGNWLSGGMDLSGIADGSNTVVVNASQTDLYGNTGNATTVTLDKDATPPGTPTVNALATTDTTPVVTGTAVAGAVVEVSVGGALYTVAANGSGQWSLDTGNATPVSGVFNPNIDGTNEVTAVVTDAAGNSSTDVTSDELIIDTVDPVAPTVTFQLTNDATPTITGTAEAGISNTITFGGATYTVIANGFGQWSLNTGTVSPVSGAFSPELNGVNDVAVTSTDVAGNSATDATVDEVTIDTTSPVLSITVAPTATSVTETAYTVGGTCESAEGNVTASIVGAFPATRSVSCIADTWSAHFDVSAVADGDDALQTGASQTDAAGNTGNASQLSDKDATPPSIAITDDGSGGDEYVNEQEESTVVVSGTSDAIDGQTVTVTFSDGANPDVVVTANLTGGSWTASAANISGLNSGTITVAADVEDALGNPAVTAWDSFTLDTNLPVLTVDTIGVTNGSIPNFSGTTDEPAGSRVTIRDDLGAVTCVATVATATPLNTWSCSPGSALPEGTYVYTAEITDIAGNTRVVDINFTIDLDMDDDGIPDAVEGIGDTDGDGTPDFMDTDSDNDGIPDLNEEQNIPALSGIDSDGDGIDDALDVDQTGGADANGDGVDDALSPSDQDGDSVPDYLDDDTDDDGIADATEGAGDADSDGVPNYRDLDSDNDGIPDELEPFDSDGDGADDYVDLDSDNDGIPDSVESNGLPLIDTDGDGLFDHVDPDSDDDGISDLAEGQTSGIDTDNDGIDDVIVAGDFDNDGVPNYLDLDSDNDGRLDVSESGLTDVNEDGIVDDGAITDTPPDTDGADGPDFIDLDSDDDGLNDIAGTIASPWDGDGDGQIDPGNATDTDGDGVADVVDGDNTRHGAGFDSDNDGVLDGVDLDDDNDGIPDAHERDNGADVDTDMDGVVDRFDLDTDNDGLPDSVESIGNNSLDDDRDGVLDDLTDSNADGLADQVSAAMMPLDTDGDGIADFRDTDSDGDGINDTTEGGRSVVDTIDADGDGVLDSVVDTDGDGLADIVDPDVQSGGSGGTPLLPADTDGDGLTDQLDVDSDSDGVLDADENGDFNNDGVHDSIQVGEPLQTAVTGGGAVLWLPIFLLGFAIASRSRRTLLPILAAIMLLPVAAARADLRPDDESPFHLAAGIGASVVDPQGQSNGWQTVGDISDGFKLRLGYRFLPKWFGEVSYVDAGEAEIGNLNPAITDVAAIDYQIPALFIGYVLMDPDQAWNVHLKLGISEILNTSNDDRVTFTGQSSAQVAGAIASHWNVSPRWFVSFEYDYYARDASFASLNIGWRFYADF